MITLTEKEFAELVEDRLFLNALRSAGVDNWEGYSYALELYDEQREQE